MLQLLHNAACWLLSAVLLLTNGLPLAVQHAHEVGDDLNHHSHQFDRFSRTSAASAVCDAESTVGAVTDHVHLLWFGWELTILPPKGGPAVPAPSISGGALLAKLDTSSSSVRDVVSAVVALLSPRLLDAAQLIGRTNRATQPRHLAALPLCDTARHLRSGVQLT